MLPWNVEFLLWIDDVRGLEVVGMAQGKASFAHLLVHDWAAASAFARQWEFPAHHLVVRPGGENDSRIRKGISSWPDLADGFAWALQQSSNLGVFIETDVRAHANPTRLANIRLAAEDLASKLHCLCPQCAAPGFGILERVAGLPCED